MPYIEKRDERLRYLDMCLHSYWHSQNELLEKYKAKGWNVSQKTLQTDLKDLGLDDDYIESKYDGRTKKFRYKDRDYTHFDPLISNSEILLMKEAISLLKRNDEIASRLTILTEKLSRHLVDSIPISGDYFQPALIEYSGEKYLLDILDACRQNTVLNISYQPFYEPEPSTHIIHPHLLKEYNNRWFLIGTNEATKDIRNLPLDRIKKISPTSLQHNRREIKDLLDDYNSVIGVTLDKSTPVIDIIFSIKASRAGYLRTKKIHHSQVELDPPDEATCKFAISVRENKELYAAFLAYGADLEILAPDEMRVRFKECFKDALELYAVE